MWKVACYGEETFGLCQSRAIMTNTSFTPRTKAAPVEMIDESRALRTQKQYAGRQETRQQCIVLVKKVKA